MSQQGVLKEFACWDHDCSFRRSWCWSEEQSSPASFTAHQSAVSTVSSHWQAHSLIPQLPVSLLSFPPPVLYNRFFSLSLTACVSGCRSWNQLCFLTAFSFSVVSFFICCRCLSLSSRLYPTFSFLLPPYPAAIPSPPPPSICSMFTCPQSAVWLRVPLPAAADLIYTPVKQARGRAWSLMTYTCKLAGSQQSLNKPRRKDEKESGDKYLALCLQAVHWCRENLRVKAVIKEKKQLTGQGWRGV